MTAADFYWRGRQAWFRYAFPAVFLATGFARRSSVTGDSFMAVASLLLLPTCLTGCSEPSTWRSSHLFLLIVTALVAVASLTVQILCRAGSLSGPVRAWIAWLKVGGVRTETCEPWSFWEVSCFAASLLSFLLGFEFGRPRRRTFLHQSGWGSLAVALSLMLCAALDLNVFSSLYHACFLWMLMALARGDDLLHLAGSIRFQNSVCCVALLHVACAIFLSSANRSDAAWIRLLGGRGGGETSAQAVCAFLLAEILLWRPRTDGNGLPLVQRTGSSELQMSETSSFRPFRLSLRSSRSSGGNAPPPPSIWVRYLQCFAGGPVLPIAALLIWSFEWPSLLAAPLLGGALLLMVLPVKLRCLRWTLIYLSLNALVLYGYNVYLSCLPDQPVTSVPTSFTWLERFGLQSFLPAGETSLSYFRLRFVCLQSLCLLMLATSLRYADHAETSGLAEKPPMVKWLCWLARIGAVVAAAAVALSSDASLIGLSILLWTLLASLSGYVASESQSGWDGTRGHACVWWLLFLISFASALSQLLWQVLRPEPFLLLGLTRSSWQVAGSVLLALLAAIQVWVFSNSVESPPSMMKSTSLPAQFLSTFGIFVPMVLMFIVVMLPPVSIFSFMVLLLFVAMAAVEQFGLHRFQSLVLTLTCLVASIQLPVRYISILPSCHLWIQNHFPEKEHEVLWEALALSMGPEEARRKLMLMVALMLVSSLMCRGCKIWSSGPVELVEWSDGWAEELKSKIRGREGYSITDQRGNRLQETSPGEVESLGETNFPLKLVFPLEDQFKFTAESRPRLVMLLRTASSWSEASVILASYFLLLSTDLLTRLQLLALTALLSSGRGWSYVGGLVSVSAMASLLIQYLLRFDFIQLSDKDMGTWLGVMWSKSLVGSEVALAGLGIAQHAIQRVASRCETAQKRQHHQGLVGHSALLGASLLLVTMVFSADAWSVVSVLVVAAFLASGDAGKSLPAPRANAWLLLMSGVLVLSLLVSWALQSWLPPEFPKPPSVEDVARWPVCGLFEGQNLVGFYGSYCFGGSNCATQRYRCGSAWISWLRLPGSGRDHNLVHFLSLFVLSLLRRTCNRARDPEAVASSSTQASSSMAVPLTEERDEIDEGSSTPGRDEKDRAMTFYNYSSEVLWLSLAGAALFQSQANVISVVYMVLLFYSIYASGHGRVKALRGVRVFNMLNMAAWAFYQCPSFPCPLLMDLDGSGASGFLSPAQCAYLEDKPSSAVYGSGTTRVVSIFLQSIGLNKVSSGVFVDWPNVLNIAIFFSSSLLAVICSRWESQLAEKMKEAEEGLEQRYVFYVSHLKCWRSLELQQVATKHQILRQKLRDLIDHLNGLRAFWSMGRPGELQEAKEASRTWRVFMQNLCLLSGAEQEQVIPALLKFAEAAGVAHHGEAAAAGNEIKLSDCVWEETEQGDWLLTEGIDEATSALLERCVLEQMRSREVFSLKRISAEELQRVEAELLEKCRQASFYEVQEVPSIQPAQCRPSLEELVRRTRPLVEAMIDDLLFCRVGSGGCLLDLTIEEHRKEDQRFFRLLGKALWSHTFELLAISAMLQFASNRSILSFGSVFTVVISQVFFPHAPPKLWRFLQFYNVFCITLKMLYQIPVFCLNGSIDFRGCSEQEETLLAVPWSAVLGLRKVSTSSSGLSAESLFEILHTDMILGAVLFFHCHVLSLGGRLRRGPEEICQEVSEDDRGPPSDAGPASPPSREATHRSVSSASVSSQDWSAAAWCRDDLSAARAQVMSTAELRKPAKDFYTIRFVLSLACFLLLLLAWNSLAGTGRSFAAALTSGVFSGTQVFAIMAVMACMIADRALYTWYTQEEGQELRRSKMAAVLQLLLLLAQLLALHGVQISAWAQSSSPSTDEVSMWGSFALICFYILYMLYLLFSSAQLRYDVHLLRGGLGLTHSVDFIPWILFKTYTSIPFVEELRVLTDWTVTSTSMNLFMWFKLEDAQQSLYKTKCDMNSRKYVKPACERPTREKILQGGLFLLALFVLIVGPLTYFSTANMFLKSNLVYMGSLKANLEVEVAGGGISQLPLYDTAQADIKTLSDDDARHFLASNPSLGTDLNVQQVGFPTTADNLWLVSNSLRQKVAAQLGSNGTKAKLVVLYQFQGPLPTNGRGFGKTPPLTLTQDQVSTLAKVLQNTSFEGEASIELPCSIQTAVLIDSSGIPSAVGANTSLRLTLTGSSPLPQWSMAGGCQPCGSQDLGNVSCSLSYVVASEKVPPTPTGDGSSTYSLMGIYLGVVYTIGRFLRAVFQEGSQRVIYEEMNDTELLQDLCSGIYIARIAGDLKSEYAFYYELLRIYRSPELLLDISKPKRKDMPHFRPTVSLNRQAESDEQIARLRRPTGRESPVD